MRRMTLIDCNIWNIFTFTICLALYRVVLIVCSTQELQDYCINESFKAQCGSDEIVIIDVALYGRMKLNRCAKTNMGYLGCKADVGDLADEKCSGRRSCEIRLPDDVFERTKPCLELQSYLQASYACLKVLPVESSECRGSQFLTAPVPTGRIASVTVQETFCGTRDTPWLIQGPKGTRINVTLTDFHAPRQQGSTVSTGVKPLKPGTEGVAQGGTADELVDLCHPYGNLVDRGLTAEGKRHMQICGRRTRTQHLLESEGNEVEVQLEPRRKNLDNFIISYEVFGCGNLQVSDSSFFERDGNKARVGCKISGEKWDITCVGNEWVGKFGNCTEMGGYEILGRASSKEEHSRSGATTAAICISTFLVIMILLLLIILLYKRRLRVKRRSAATCMTSSLSHDDVDGCRHHHHKASGSKHNGEELEYVRPSRSHYGRHHHRQHHHDSHSHQHHHHHHHHADCIDDQDSDYGAEYEKVGSFGKGTTGKYTHIWEMPLPIPGES